MSCEQVVSLAVLSVFGFALIYKLLDKYLGDKSMYRQEVKEAHDRLVREMERRGKVL